MVMLPCDSRRIFKFKVSALVEPVDDHVELSTLDSYCQVESRWKPLVSESQVGLSYDTQKPQRKIFIGDGFQLSKS